MYCSIADIKRLLPANISVGSTTVGKPVPGSPEKSDRSKVSTDQLIHHIRFAQQEVDGRLRAFYVSPLRKIKSFETDILNNISAGSNVEIRVWDTNNMAVGDTVRMQGAQNLEEATITAVPNNTTVTLNRIQRDYDIESGKISIIEFPDPVPLITARLAASYVYDELFAAEQSPTISEYGEKQRSLAGNSLDSILSGTILLQGQERTGRRFVRGSLLDAYDSPTMDFQFGREKG
tara:strand:+ start:73610 stop:74311 length:702 start_codon:yes stop_codon:yes gene_type:complete